MHAKSDIKARNPTEALYRLMAINVATDSIHYLESRILEVSLLLLTLQKKNSCACAMFLFINRNSAVDVSFNLSIFLLVSKQRKGRIKLEIINEVNSFPPFSPRA